MSETSSGQIEKELQTNDTDNAQLDAQSVQQVLVKNRLKQMSRSKKVACALGFAVLLALVGFGLYRWMGSNSDTEFLTMEVSRGNVMDSIEATGTLEPVKKSEMGFKSDGTITALTVQPGDRVKAGQVLAEQDPSNLASALQQAESSLAQDEINIKSCTLTYESKLKTMERQKKLYEAGAIPLNELETAQDDVARSEWEIATAKAKLLNDQAKVAEARSDLAKATLTAPFDGIIGAVNGQVGQINGINSSTSTLLTVMSEELQLSALVNEADIGRIKVDQDVEFSSSAYSDKVFKGKVLRITPEAETVSNVQYYPVLISCLDPEHQLRSGMSVTAKIIVSSKTDVVRVSMMAVSFGQSYSKSSAASENAAAKAPAGTASGGTTIGKPGTVVLLQNNQPVLKKIILGLSDGINYEVIDGLDEGDSVIVGTNQAGSSASSTRSSTNTTNNNSNRQNQRSGGFDRPPGF